jgi:hypothetical protein
VKVIVSSDHQLTEREAHEIREYLDHWLASDQEVLVMNGGLHATAERPDGTWVRICHHEPDEPVEAPE